jgi:hypothetical protein
VSGITIPQDYTITLKDGDFLDVRLSGAAAPIATRISGDKDNPIATLVLGDPNKPLTTLLTGDKLKPIATLLTGDPKQPISTLLTGDPKQPIATTFELLNIPRLSLADIKELMTPRLRVRMPNYEQICVKLLGFEVFSVCLSGEFQTITEGYQPNRFERCDLGCPDLDERPFPTDTPTHQKAES